MTPSRPLRVAIVGSRGIPANYGGFETFAEQLGSRLAAAGWDVTVYGRAHHVPAGLERHLGCRIVAVPTIRSKHLDTVVATVGQVIHAMGENYDAVLAVNAANAPFLLPLKLLRVPLVLNVDGIERMRAKWGITGRLWYRLGEAFAALLPDVVVADAGVIADYYRQRHSIEPVVIPYGSDLPAPTGNDTLRQFGLVENGYLLYVSRFEPENNPHRVVEEYRRLRERVADPPPLVMVGDAPYQKEWIASWKLGAPPGVIFTGGVYGEGYRELLSGCFAYIQATEVGGTHPALVEAMGFGCRLFYNRTPENVEVAEGCGVPFDAREKGSLAAVLERSLDETSLWAVYRSEARSRARERYSWTAVADAYARLLASVVTC